MRLEERRSTLRVTAVTTTVRTERTSQGFGVGTPETRVERAFAAQVLAVAVRAAS